MMEKLLKDQLEQKETIKSLTSQMSQLFAHNKMLKNQIASQASSSRQSGMFPSQPENSRKQAKAIMLRSGKKLPEVEIKKQDEGNDQTEQEKEQKPELIEGKKEEK